MLFLCKMCSALLGISLLGFLGLGRYLAGSQIHHDEMFDGAGRSTNVLFTIFTNGWVFRMLVISVLVVE